MIVRVSVDQDSGNERPNSDVQTHPIPSANSLNINAGPSIGSIPPRTTWDVVCLRVIYIFAFAGMLCAQVIQFSRDNWSVECGRDLQIWTVTTTSTFLFLLIRGLIPMFWPQFDSSFHDPRRWCRFLMKSYNGVGALTALFQFCWFVRGGILLFFIDEGQHRTGCAKAPWTWSVSIWTAQALMYFCPCLLILLLVPCVMCYFAFFHEPDQDNRTRTPDEIMERLPKKRYAEVLAQRYRQSGSGTGPEHSPSMTRTANNGGFLNGLPDVMGVTNLLSRLGSTGGAAHRSTERLMAQNNDNMCAICVCEFEADDMVIQLPCDPRHIYHDTCLLEWLARSQVCPMCRRNIVELIEEAAAP